MANGFHSQAAAHIEIAKSVNFIYRRGDRNRTCRRYRQVGDVDLIRLVEDVDLRKRARNCVGGPETHRHICRCRICGHNASDRLIQFGRRDAGRRGARDCFRLRIAAGIGAGDDKTVGRLITCEFELQRLARPQAQSAVQQCQRPARANALRGRDGSVRVDNADLEGAEAQSAVVYVNRREIDRTRVGDENGGCAIRIGIGRRHQRILRDGIAAAEHTDLT